MIGICPDRAHGRLPDACSRRNYPVGCQWVCDSIGCHQLAAGLRILGTALVTVNMYPMIWIECLPFAERVSPVGDLRRVLRRMFSFAGGAA